MTEGLEEQIKVSCYLLVEQLGEKFFSQVDITPCQFMTLVRLYLLEKIKSVSEKELSEGVILTKAEIIKIADSIVESNSIVKKFIKGEVALLGINNKDVLSFGIINYK